MTFYAHLKIICFIAKLLVQITYICTTTLLLGFLCPCLIQISNYFITKSSYFFGIFTSLSQDVNLFSLNIIILCDNIHIHTIHNGKQL